MVDRGTEAPSTRSRSRKVTREQAEQVEPSEVLFTSLVSSVISPECQPSITKASEVDGALDIKSSNTVNVPTEEHIPRHSSQSDRRQKVRGRGMSSDLSGELPAKKRPRSANLSDCEEAAPGSSEQPAKKAKAKAKATGKRGQRSRAPGSPISQREDLGGEIVQRENGSSSPPAKTPRKKARGVTNGDVKQAQSPPKKVNPQKRRATKEEMAAAAIPLRARTTGLAKMVGAHVSGAKGVQNSVNNAVHIGGNAFAMFLKSQRKWENPPLQADQCQQFIDFCSDKRYDAGSHVLPHGSYLVNLAQEDKQKAKQGFDAFLDDLKRCDSLGIRLYNFHPGWTGSATRSSAIERIAKALNQAHAATASVAPVLETMAGSGNVVGSTFEDLRDIISLVDDKSRIGVCIDTCHIFAAGYDLRSPEAFAQTMKQFDDVVGTRYLKALHINDSKAPLASHRDLHQNIGTGFLGLRAFHSVMNEANFDGLPLILETPIEITNQDGKTVEDKGIWAKEIGLLESLIGQDADSSDFKVIERKLADKGAAERAKYAEAFEKKLAKEKKLVEKGQAKLSFRSGARGDGLKERSKS